MSNSASDSSTATRSPLIGAIVAQVLGAVVSILLFVFIMPEILAYPVLAGLIQGASASMMSYRLHAPRWWQAIHLAFPPLAILGHSLALPPLLWLIAFALLLLIFWRTDQSRVPLFLTNATTAGAIAQLIPSGPRYVLDIGCGDGGLLRRLARSRPDCEFVGIEHAPLTWLWARLRASSLPNVHIRLGDFWKQPLAAYDLVYAFLSPAPMPALWHKASEEMRPGCLLVSNSFAVPDQTALNTIDVADKRQSQLYCYRPGD